MAKFERDNFKLKLEKVNLHEILEGILQSTELKVTESGGTLQSSLQAVNFNIRADKFHLTNILHNLLDNAIKYCKDAPEIKVTTEDSKGGLVLKIADNGIGIPKEYLPKVFNKFYRVPTGNVHNVKGFGLGLFYLKNICAAHGWKINLESKEKKGTIVSIFIKSKKRKGFLVSF